MANLSSLFVSTFACSLLMVQAAHGETFVEQEVSTRLVVSVLVPEAKAQKWLPDPWRVSPSASGASKGANLGLVFSERMLKLDGAGKPAPDAAERTLALNVLARNTKTGETTGYVIRIYTSNPKNLPGAYSNSRQATIEHDQSSKGTGVSSGAVSQAWTVRDSKGGSVDFQVQYESGSLAPSKAESKSYGGSDPTLFRIFRVEQGVDAAKSTPNGVDRTKGAKLRVTVPDLLDLLDGSEQVISIVAAPWYVRHVFLP